MPMQNMIKYEIYELRPKKLHECSVSMAGMKSKISNKWQGSTWVNPMPTCCGWTWQCQQKTSPPEIQPASGTPLCKLDILK